MAALISGLDHDVAALHAGVMVLENNGSNTSLTVLSSIGLLLNLVSVVVKAKTPNFDEKTATGPDADTKANIEKTINASKTLADVAVIDDVAIHAHAHNFDKKIAEKRMAESGAPLDDDHEAKLGSLEGETAATNLKVVSMDGIKTVAKGQPRSKR